MALTHEQVDEMRRLMADFLDEVDATIDASEVPVDGGPLDHLELSGDTLDVLIGSPGVSPPEGTHIGSVIGRDAEGLEVELDEVVLLDDADGRFRLDSNATGNMLVATGRLADFEDPGDPANGVNPRPIQYYAVVITTLAGDLTVTTEFRIRPRYPHIDPAGGEGCTVVKPTGMSGLYGELGAASGKVVSLEKMTGVHKATGLNQLKPKLTRVSVVGHPAVCMRHGQAWMFRDGNDVVVEGMAFRAGMPSSAKEIDNLTVGEGATDWVRNMHFRNCSFSSSNDELMRVNDTDKDGGHACRHIRLSYCMFAEAFFDANHPKGTQHNHGPALSGRCQDIVMDHCLIGSNDIRNPQLTYAIHGVAVVNCLIFHWLEHTNFAGINVVGCSSGTQSEAWPLTCRIEGNLFHPVGRGDNSYGERRNAIFLYRLDGSKVNVYIPDGGSRPNHFISPVNDSFHDDLLVIDDGITIRECWSDFAVNRGTPPFEWAPAFEQVLHPTETEEQRRDLFADIMEHAGNGSQYDADIKELIRAGTTRMNVTPDQHAARYGAEWDGVGGSLKHGVC